MSRQLSSQFCGQKISSRQLLSQLSDQIFFPMISGKENGSGIGLSISQDIVRIHGGAISFERKDGQTIFSILIPISNTNIQGAKSA